MFDVLPELTIKAASMTIAPAARFVGFFASLACYGASVDEAPFRHTQS
jgi:hypothetical protein